MRRSSGYVNEVESLEYGDHQGLNEKRPPSPNATAVSAPIVNSSFREKIERLEQNHAKKSPLVII